MSIETPYVGPKPFETKEQLVFFGRDWEAEQLIALVVAHPAVLFYAQSGAGKSSLLNAKVLPDLESKEECEVLPVARLRGDLPPDLDADRIDNLYLFNTLLGWLELRDGLAPEDLTQMSLRDFLSQIPRRADNQGYPALRVLILDQFEELFTFYPDRWPEREKFFEQVAGALAADAYLRVLFVIREEYLAQVDTYAQLLPEQLRPRFRLERLGPEAALAAVEEPLKMTDRSFGPGVAQKLVDELLKIRVRSADGHLVEGRGRFVEPVQLQVVCQSLWLALPEQVKVISAENVEQFGDVDQALTRFYERAVHDTVQRLSRWPAITEWQIRNWFEDELITPAGTRGLVYRGETKTGSVRNEAVDLLDNHHLIRGESRAGGRWYELTHDRFINPILRANKAWRIETLKRLAKVLSGVVVVALALVFAGGAMLTWSEQTDTSQVIRQSIEVVAAAAQRAEGAEATANAAVQQAAGAEATASVVAGEATQIRVTAEAFQDVQATSTAAAQNVRTERVRPLRAGLSIGGLDTTAGTLGYFVVDDDGQVYMVSAAEVLGNTIGGEILQPGPFDGGRAPEDVVGELATSVVPLRGANSIANLTALARLNDTVEYDPAVPSVGPLAGVRAPTVGMPVRKLGRATGWTAGEIVATGESFTKTVDDFQVTYSGAALARMETSPGNNGALVIDAEGYAIGIVVETTPNGVWIAPLTEILDFYEVQLLPPALNIIDSTESLKRNADRTFPSRDPAQIDRIIVHHTVTDPSTSVERVAEAVVDSGLPGITYHYCVTDRGTIYLTQPLDLAPGQTPRASRTSIDVCLIGNFTDQPPSSVQLNAAALLIADLVQRYDIPLDQIYGRRELEATNESPGRSWPTWKPDLLAKVEAFLQLDVPVLLATPTPSASKE